MSHIALFIAGFIVGGVVGVLLMALCCVAKDS